MSPSLSRALSSSRAARSLAWAAGLALALAACVSIAPNTLSGADTANLRFAGVEVRHAADATVRWSAAEDAYLKSRNLPTTDPALVGTPEARGYVADLAAGRLRAALERRLSARAAGARPVRVVATIRQVVVPSAAERLIVGGHPRVQADIAIHDARTDAVLTRYSGDTGQGMAGAGVAGVLLDAAFVAGGADDLYDRAADNYAHRFDAWLNGA